MTPFYPSSTVSRVILCYFIRHVATAANWPCQRTSAVRFQKDSFNIILHNKQASRERQRCTFDILFRSHFDPASRGSTFQVSGKATCADPIGEEYEMSGSETAGAFAASHILRRLWCCLFSAVNTMMFPTKNRWVSVRAPELACQRKCIRVVL